MPPLPKGEASALPDSASASREDALAPPLGELAKPKALTERVSNFHTKSPRHLATAGAKLQILKSALSSASYERSSRSSRPDGPHGAGREPCKPCRKLRRQHRTSDAHRRCCRHGRRSCGRHVRACSAGAGSQSREMRRTPAHQQSKQTPCRSLCKLKSCLRT